MANVVKPRARLTSSQVREFRSAVARLKKLGIVSKSVDARKQTATRYMREKVNRFADVLQGRAKTVTVSREAAKGYKGVFPTTATKVAVPAAKSDRVRFDRKSGEIIAERSSARGKYVSRIRKSGSIESASQLPELMARERYAIPLNGPGGERYFQRFTSRKDLIAFMSEYNRYKNWYNYVEIQRLKVKETDEFDEPSNAPAAPKSKPNPATKPKKRGR